MNIDNKIKVIKENYKYIDLYGDDLFFDLLKDTFSFFSFRKKSVPNLGSNTFPVNCLKIKDCKIVKIIFHKTKKITVQTDKAFIQFFN